MCTECSKIIQHSRKRLSKEEFVRKAVEVHGDRYDYSEVNYLNRATKICIICRIHGEFWQGPGDHMKGSGCPACGVESFRKKLTKTSTYFIDRARIIHGDKYDYSKVLYTNSTTKVCIICKEHGEFWQAPYSHLARCGCRECGKISSANFKRFSKKAFIVKAIKKHGDNYDYSKVVYVGSNKKVCIICSRHGEFWQTPNMHLSGRGCTKCGIDKVRECHAFSISDFISKAISVHGDRYDYSEVDYSNNRINVCIVCGIHGKFWQAPKVHLSGGGCYKCGKKVLGDKLRSDTEEFVSKAKRIHSLANYDYSKVKYINNHVKVCIVCNKHGEFWQVPNNHLIGEGCPFCNSSRGELSIIKWLVDNKIEYNRQQEYPDLKGFSRRLLRFDFYILGSNLLIEYDGEQHTRPVRFRGVTQERVTRNFKKLQHNDALKNKYCADNGIPLLRISYKDFKRIPEILSDAILRYRKAA